VIHVLVVEDEPTLLQVLRLNLSSRGYRVSVAATQSAALDLGAVEYIVKPFAMTEFMARVNAAARHSNLTEPEPVVTIGRVSVDLSHRLVTRCDDPDQIVRLAPSSYLRIYMQQLRRKLEPDPANPRHLLTEPGLGYRYRS